MMNYPHYPLSSFFHLSSFTFLSYLLLSHPSPFPLSSTHLLILSSSHPLILTSSHPLILSSSHPLIHSSSHPLILSSSHPLILSSSHPLILSSSHPLILSSSHPLILRPQELAFLYEKIGQSRAALAVYDELEREYLSRKTIHTYIPQQNGERIDTEEWESDDFPVFIQVCDSSCIFDFSFSFLFFSFLFLLLTFSHSPSSFHRHLSKVLSIPLHILIITEMCLERKRACLSLVCLISYHICHMDCHKFLLLSLILLLFDVFTSRLGQYMWEIRPLSPLT
jgi:hypothetical protein